MNVDVHEGEKVVDWKPDGSGVRVDTDRSTYYGQFLVITAGPWITKQVPQLKVRSFLWLS